MDNWEIIELLECIKINIKNSPLVAIIQIDEALALLTDDVMDNGPLPTRELREGRPPAFQGSEEGD